MIIVLTLSVFCVYFSNVTVTTDIYTLSLHDALPIWHPDELHGLRCRHRRLQRGRVRHADVLRGRDHETPGDEPRVLDRKSTRLNSSHVRILYAVFCLKKKINHYSSNNCKPQVIIY